MFKEITVEELQKRIKQEWKTCVNDYIKGSDMWDDKVWAEKCCQRAFTFGQAIGEMLEDNVWYQVFTDEFNAMWMDVRSIFFIRREDICESEYLMRGISEEVIEWLDET
jgi:hypothetical protein